MKTTRLPKIALVSTPSNEPQTFEAMVAGYLSAPSLDGWNRIAHKVFPGTFRTLWKAWATVDGGAPVLLNSGAFQSFPDAYTLRRAIKAMGDGKVRAGLGSPRMATVPR